LEWADTLQETWATNGSSVVGLSDVQVRAIVDEALAKYDADKTGLVDYALESSGKLIIDTEFVTFCNSFHTL
jgi:predicted nucleic-acid-binding protein